MTKVQMFKSGAAHYRALEAVERTARNGSLSEREKFSRIGLWYHDELRAAIDAAASERQAERRAA